MAAFLPSRRAAAPTDFRTGFDICRQACLQVLLELMQMPGAGGRARQPCAGSRAWPSERKVRARRGERSAGTIARPTRHDERRIR
jgi:hypothetical protein